MRARSALFARPIHRKPLSTFDAFTAAARFDKNAANYWLRALEALTMADAQEILDRVPHGMMSSSARQFALRLLELNRAKLLTWKG